MKRSQYNAQESVASISQGGLEGLTPMQVSTSKGNRDKVETRFSGLRPNA